MKQLILHPLVFTLLLLVSLVYFVIGFQLISTNATFSKNIERFFIVLSMLIISGMTINFTGRLHPSAFYVHGQTLPYIVMAFSFYTPFFLLLSSRLAYTLKESVFVLSTLVKRVPFFFIFIILRLISSISSGTPVYTLRAMIILLVVTSCFIYVGKQYNMQGLFTILLWHHGVVLLLSLFFGRGENWQGIYIHKNFFGFTMAMSVILFYLQSVRVPKYRLFFIGIAAIAVFCTQQSHSGMGKVLLIILILLLVFLRFIRRLPPRLAFASMGIFLAIGVSIVILITDNAEYIVVEKLGKSMTLTGRTYIWPLVVAAINRRPLFGYGYEGFWQFWRGLDNPAITIRPPELNGFIPESSHNGYLEIGLEVGWIGLIVFILSLVTGIYYGVLHLTRSKEPEAVLPLLIFTWIVMISITEVGINQITMLWIVYVLMTTRLTLDTAENYSNNPQLQKHLALESRSPFNRTRPREGG